MVLSVYLTRVWFVLAAWLSPPTDGSSLPLNLNFPDAFSVTYPDAYERLLMEVLRGNPALFMRRDEIETAWSWIDRIIDSWHTRGVRTHEYMAGSWGPTDAFVLLDRDGRRWYEG